MTTDTRSKTFVVVGATGGVGRVFASTLSCLRHTFRHSYSTLLRSVGTEFKVMQELLRYSTLRSTLDVDTQAITPAMHAAQEAVCRWSFLPVRMEDRKLLPRSHTEKRAQKGRRTRLFAPSTVSTKVA